MEKLLKILILLVLITGCTTTKKMTESTDVNSSVSAEEKRSIKANDAVKIDNDIASDEETTTEQTKTEFYAPDSGSPQKPDSGSVKKQVDGRGAIKSITTTKTKKSKKDSDKSKVAAKSEMQEDASLKAKKQEAGRSQKSEVRSRKFGVAWWKIGGVILLALLAIYFLVKKNIVRIGFLTKVVAWINGVLGSPGGKTA
jgi:hypothetical protein